MTKPQSIFQRVAGLITMQMKLWYVQFLVHTATRQCQYRVGIWRRAGSWTCSQWPTPRVVLLFWRPADVQQLTAGAVCSAWSRWTAQTRTHHRTSVTRRPATHTHGKACCIQDIYAHICTHSRLISVTMWMTLMTVTQEITMFLAVFQVEKRIQGLLSCLGTRTSSHFQTWMDYGYMLPSVHFIKSQLLVVCTANLPSCISSMFCLETRKLIAWPHTSLIPTSLWLEIYLILLLF